MKLSVALNKLKTLKSKIAQTEVYIASCITMYEDETPDYEYLNEIKARNALVTEIHKLKTAIQLTNAATVVVFRNTKMSMSELILHNAQVRSEMKFVMGQISAKLDINRFDSRSKDDVKKVYASGYSKDNWRIRLSELEIEKEELDVLMANTNAKTDIVSLS